MTTTTEKKTRTRTSKENIVIEIKDGEGWMVAPSDVDVFTTHKAALAELRELATEGHTYRIVRVLGTYTPKVETKVVL